MKIIRTCRARSEARAVPVLRLSWLVAIALCAALAGCGGSAVSTEESDSEDAAAAAEAQKQEEAAREREERRQKQQAAYDECVEIWGAFRSELEELDSRLSVGLNIGDYTTAIGDARVEYDKATGGDLGSQKCLDSARRLENAYNAYVRGSTKWQKCIDDYNCDFNDSDLGRGAQQDWVRASTALTNSHQALERMQPN